MAPALKHAVALAVAAAAAAGVISALDWGLRSAIEKNRRDYELRLLREVLANVDYAELVSAPAPPEIDRLWLAQKDGRTLAAALQIDAEGYNGKIVFLMAFDRSGRRIATRIVRHSETPGIADFLSETVGGERAIDGVSGATITSNAAARAADDARKWIETAHADVFENNAQPWRQTENLP